MDWAGTTVDFGCQGPVQAFVEAFQEFDIPVTVAEAREPMGMGKREHVAALFAMPRIAALWKERFNARPDASAVDSVYEKVERSMLDVIGRYSVPIQGSVKAIETMRSMGLAIGSCTGYPRSVGEALAKTARKLGYEPDVLVCATDVPEGRPAPDMCLEVLKRLKVPNPTHAVKIGDTVNDVLEGLRAGMWVIGITLTGSLAGQSEEEMEALPENEKNALHEDISRKLLAAGAHYTARDLPSCIPVLKSIMAHGS